MNASLWLSNILAWSVQIAILAAAAGLLAWALRLKEPRAMLACWHGVLLACLALPLVSRWDRPVVRPVEAVVVESASAAAPLPAPAFSGWPLILPAMGAGIALRAAWLLVGLYRLSRYRRQSTLLEPLPPPLPAVVSPRHLVAAGPHSPRPRTGGRSRGRSPYPGARGLSRGASRRGRRPDAARAPVLTKTPARRPRGGSG